MNTKNSRVIVLLAAVMVLLVTLSCAQTGTRVRVGELRTKSESVELDGAESVRANLTIAAGELNVSGGADGLLNADFTYNVAELEPEVEYSGGTLTVRNPDVDVTVDSWWDLDDYRHEWDLRLNDDVSMEMIVRMGAGEADLELGSLSLTRLDVETGAGEVTIDLADSSTLTRLNVDVGVGQTTVDLTGDWQDDLDVDIAGGVGELILLLPSGVGVRVDVVTGLGDVNTRGLSKDGNEYVNDAYGESEVTLRIDITAGVGNIRLEVVE